MFIESRRNFLKGTAAAVAGIGVAKGVFSTIIQTDAVAAQNFTNTPTNLEFYPPLEQWDDFKELDGDDWKRGGIERHGIKSDSNPDGIKVNNYMIVPTACSNCEASCGLTAWIDKDTMTVKKYMGNPLHAGSRGRNCAKGYAAQSQMYDPDRIPFPLKRAPGSKRGEGKWVRTTWDEAMDTIGKKMGDTLRRGDEISKKAVMFHVGRPNENGFTGHFWHTLGCDAFNSHTNICSSGGRTGTIQWANDDRTSPDWAKSKVVFLNSSHAADAGHYFQQSAGFIADARKAGAKLIVMDNRLSNSAGIADLWISPWPGTEGAIYLYLANRILQEDKVDHEFVRKWVNWEVLMNDDEYLEYMLKNNYITKLPKDRSYESFIELLKDLYAPYTLNFAAQECRVPEEKLEELYDIFIWGGNQVTSYFWRATAAGNRGGWMNAGRTGYLPLVLRGSIGGEGGTFFHHWHVISVAGKGYKSTVYGKNAPKVDVWNELAWPPEWPLSTYEMSYLLPHLLSDKEWQEKWRNKGLKVPEKLSVWIPRMYNPVWINPDGFRWIEVLKDESKMELTFNLSPIWSETNWFVDYILPVGLAGERHDQHSEATMPARWTSFRQPVLRVALEKMGWKPKDPTRATLEAHIKAGLGEVWEENEFWFNMAFKIDPDGSLGVREQWESKKHPGRPVTIAEWYDAAFRNLPNLTKAAEAAYPNSEYPVYEFMRDRGTWLEEDNIYNAQEREIKYDPEKNAYISHGHEYPADEVEKDDTTGVLYVEHHGEKKPIGIEIDGKKMEGFATLDKKLDFYCQWLAKEWKWPEYAVPFYPRTESEKDKYVHIVSHVHHRYMKEPNSFALNTIFRLPYNIHTRSVNSKHLMEISQNHNPIWINTQDAKRLGIKKGDPVRVRIVDTVSGLESGYFVAMAVPTEGMRPGVLANSHHAGRWKLKNSVKIPGFEHELGVLGFGAPLADMKMDGKVGQLKYKEGIHPRNNIWQFKDYNKDADDVWWDGLTGSWQNAVAPTHPDPISGMHCWHQKVLLEPAQPGDKIGDVYVNYENNFKTYQAWRDKLTRPLTAKDKLRRPMHIKRPWVPLSRKAYEVEIKE
ncbi:molybdopterin-dependent oxidoreductase [Nitrosophilus alvini]|uniref:molybdopterin-dependent oxidoreductase n=1 Tax=Nitrosophilus alvini TaxID=2714855 RepID=UPI00190E585C|nr:molybdopterin-dependent oxidoreductase [Nitrosophilus alvini]